MAWGDGSTRTPGVVRILGDFTGETYSHHESANPKPIPQGSYSSHCAHYRKELTSQPRATSDASRRESLRLSKLRAGRCAFGMWVEGSPSQTDTTAGTVHGQSFAPPAVL